MYTAIHHFLFNAKNKTNAAYIFGNAIRSQFPPLSYNITNVSITLLACLFAGQVTAQQAEPQEQRQVSMELYGHVMTDGIYDFKQVHPDWFDVLRPTKLPSFKNEFGKDGETYFSVRQSRFGVRGYLPTSLGELKTTFEFELFGTGIDAGQTTFRLRHAYGELGKFGFGQTWSPFMDIDVFPNSLEYWGPNGMVFFRNIQLRYMPIQGDTRLTIALERPGASADQGVYANRIELEGVRPQFTLPDLSAEYRYGKKWGYVELAGMLRRMAWKDIATTNQFDLNGSALGWGLNLSSGLKFFTKDMLHLQVVYGKGIENYMNDAPVDVGIQAKEGADPRKPVEGVALPILGAVAFYDRYWSDKFSSTIGYSLADIDNSDRQAPNAFKQGHYALTNLIYYPAPNFLTGIEVQYGKRKNFSDGWNVSDYRVQLSFKYNFSQKFYREPKTTQ